tara:strand:- start:230 stop:403 length:174 start_codon:yes stop_codon:yes gene_type:complete
MKIVKHVLVAAALLTTTSVFAQTPTPPTSGNASPIDGGIAILAIAGAGYGVYKKIKK